MTLKLVDVDSTYRRHGCVLSDRVYTPIGKSEIGAMNHEMDTTLITSSYRDLIMMFRHNILPDQYAYEIKHCTRYTSTMTHPLSRPEV